MTITRIIEGKEIGIELTKQELFDAFVEQEHIWDVSYVTDESEDDDRFNGFSNKEIADAFEEIAYEMRRRANKYDESDFDAYTAAVDGFFERKEAGEA